MYILLSQTNVKCSKGNFVWTPFILISEKLNVHWLEEIKWPSYIYTNKTNIFFVIYTNFWQYLGDFVD